MTFKKNIIQLVVIITIFFSNSTTHAATNYLQFPDLKLGDNSSYVQDVQKFLNSNGFIVNKTEGQAGSLNNEVTKFGGLTQKALMNFQSNYGLKPAKGYFGTKTKTKFDELQNKGNSTDLSSGTPIASSVYENKFGPSDCRVEGGNTVVRHWGFTWVVEGQRQCGQFVNGEWWVTGPTRLISSSVTQRPGIDNPINDGALDPKYSGTMKNPVPEQAQGFAFRVSFLDNTGKETLPKSSYDPNLNLRLKPADHPDRNLVPGDSIVSSKYGQGENLVTRHSTLTVVSTPPPEGSFRPPVYGNISRQVKFNKSQLNFGYFQNLDPVSNTPSQSEMELKTPPGTWLEWGSQFYANAVGPASEMVADGNGRAGDSIVPDSNYGADIAEKWGQTALWLNTRNPGGVAAKEQVAINMVQAGIDIAGYVEAGGGFPSNGGHKLGRKLPVLIAGVMLNDPKIKAIAANPKIFSEDRNVWYISEADYDIDFNPNNGPDTPRPIRVVYNNGSYSGERDDDGVLDPGKKIKYAHVKYTRAMHGIAEAGARHSDEPASDDADTQPKNYNSYRGIIGPYMSSSWLAAALMGIQEYWNHPAAFGYMERQKNIPGGGTRGRLGESMYKYYKSNTPKIEGSAGKFYTGDRITINITTTSPATIYYTTNGSTPTTSSTRYTGPFTIGQTSTIKAIGVTATETSSVTSATYEIRPIAEKPLPKTGWTVRYVSSQQNTNGAAYPASNVLDGNDSTFWHSRYEPTYDPAPYTLDIDMKKSYDVSFFKYTPRQDSPNGRLQGYKFYMSQDGTNWGNPVVSGTFDRNDTQEQLVTLPSTAGGRYFRIVMDEGLNGNGTIGELNVAGVLSGTQPAIPVPDNTQYTLTRSVVGQGSIGGTSGTSFTNGTTVNLTATPNPGYIFTGWSGDCSGTQATCNLVVDGNSTVTATFSIPTIIVTTRNLIVNRNGNGNVSGVNSANTTFANNASVTLTATPSTGSRFVNWSGDCSGTQATCTVIMNANKTVTANFELIPATPTTPTLNPGLIPIGPVTQTPVTPVSTPGPITLAPGSLSRNGWTVRSISSQEVSYEGSKVLDNDSATFWHTSFNIANDPAPYNIDVDMKQAYSVTAFRYLPRQDSPNGRLQEYKFYLSQDGTNWGQPVASGNFDFNNTQEQTVTLPSSVSGRYFRLEAGKGYGLVGTFASVAELGVVGAPSALLTTSTNGNGTISGSDTAYIIGSTDTLTAIPASGSRFVNWSGDCSGIQTTCTIVMNSAKTVIANFQSIIPQQDASISKSNWTVRAVNSQENTTSFAGSNTFDGNSSTFWHTKFTPSFDPAPYTLDIDMKQVNSIKSFKYTPRQDSPNGRLQEYKFYLSQDGTNWGQPVASGNFDFNNTQEQTVTLPSSVSGRYFRLEAGKGYGLVGTFASVAELGVVGISTGQPVSGKFKYTLTKNLTVGNSDFEVVNLQKFLNNSGYPVATSGIGSKGKESTYFGEATRSALAKFQSDNGILPANGYFGEKTRVLLNNK